MRPNRNETRSAGSLTSRVLLLGDRPTRPARAACSRVIIIPCCRGGVDDEPPSLTRVPGGANRRRRKHNARPDTEHAQPRPRSHSRARSLRAGAEVNTPGARTVLLLDGSSTGASTVLPPTHSSLSRQTACPPVPALDRPARTSRAPAGTCRRPGPENFPCSGQGPDRTGSVLPLPVVRGHTGNSSG